MGEPGQRGAALDEDELRQLDEFLRSEATPEGCMSLDQLDGFLNALVCGPQTLLPAEYLAQVWGGVDTGAAAPAPQVVDWITRLHEDIARQLAGPGEYQPLLRRGTDRDGCDMVFTEAWCDGFLRGIVCCQESWEPHLAQLHDQLAPILDFAAQVARADDLLNETLRARALALADELPSATAEIYRYWREQPAPSPGVTAH